MKTFIIEEKFTGYADITIEAETEEEAIALYNRGHYPDSEYVIDDMFYDFEFLQYQRGKMSNSMQESVEIMSDHYVQRFKFLLEGEMLNLQVKRHRDAQSIMSEYLCGGVEDDNYKWMYLPKLED